MKFSERLGFSKPKSILQKDSIDEELRNMLWEVLHNHVFNSAFLDEYIYQIWTGFYKKPSDTIKTSRDGLGRNLSYGPSINFIRSWYFEAKFYQIYDLLEFCSNLISEYNSKYNFIRSCNVHLEIEKSAYRFIDCVIVPIIDEVEINEIDSALQKTDRFSGARNHIKSSLEFYSRRKNPDYRNSVKESISAVESVVKQMNGNSKGTLGELLKKIATESRIHRAMIGAFEKLYGYTSDEDGIRHAMLDEEKTSEDEARFMLVACSAFVNFLISASAK